MAPRSETKMEPAPLIDTPASAHARLKASFATGLARPLSFRMEQLRLLRRFLSETESDLHAALHKDLRRHRSESILYEHVPMFMDISYMLKNLPRLARDRRISSFYGAPAVVTPSPKGTILIIGPCNYPVHLLVRPLIAALAAGNAVVLKPSEHTPACAAYVSRLTEVLDPRIFAIVQGDADVSKELLTYQWDHIMFTGSPRVGRLVLAAAAPHLTPVTLELGGKNPAFVTASSSLRTTAESIVRSRFLNAGQICLAVEYALVDDAVYDDFMTALCDAIKTIYGPDPKNCPHFGRLVTAAHWEHVAARLASTKGNVVLGGDTDKDDRYVAPTVVEIDSADDPLMEEEVFGPILSVIRIKSMDEGLNIVNALPSPLAVYLFGNKKATRSLVDRTRSGTVGVNETVMQVFPEGSFVGGFGESGMGAYGTARGFEEFSHLRPVLWSSPMFANTLRVVRPDIMAKYGVIESAFRILKGMPFPNSKGEPVDEKLGRLLCRMLVVFAVVGVAVAVKIALG